MNRDAHRPLRVLVLGGSGHIGARWLQMHAATAPAAPDASPLALEAFSASRHAAAGQARTLALDIRDAAPLRQAVPATSRCAQRNFPANRRRNIAAVIAPPLGRSKRCE